MNFGPFSISSIAESCRNSYLAQAISPLLVRCSDHVEGVVSSILSRNFYAGYVSLDFKVAEERTQNLIKKLDAFPLQCQNIKGIKMDVFYIQSSCPNRTGNAVVFAETTSYQDRLGQGLPPKYKYFLDCGADIVLWNPTELQSNQYAQDLLSVLEVLKKQNPHQKIVVKGHCAAVEPAIAAAAGLTQKLNDDSISLILDRGYADTFAFARSFTVLAKLPWIHRIIQSKFSCGGMEKLKTFPGKIIFIAPKDPTADQVVYWAGKNWTYAMHEWRKTNGFSRDVFIKLGEESDHWSSWNANEYNQISAELNKIGIILSNFSEFSSEASSVRLPRTFWKRTCFPILTKAWC